MSVGTCIAGGSAREMMTLWPRRLTLVVAPAYGESFTSWADRMALRNGPPRPGRSPRR